MRIPSDKPTFAELPRTREKTGPSAPARATEGRAAVRPGEPALPAESVSRAVQDADIASREFEKTISARLDEVREQLRGGTYGIDYDRLASRMADEGFGS
jgi:anti-sigma28 factor (negative regulator of flagellin synthesis)